jgi:serine/threonine protein kinase
MCEPSSRQTDEDLSKCEVLDSKPLSAFRILSMTYGGSPLHNYRFKVDSFVMMNFFTHLISAGALLSLFGIIHRDLHQGNILVDNETIPRIIDFNLSIIKEHVTADELSHSHNVTLPQESPDAVLVNAISLGYKRSTVIRSIIHKKPIIKKISALLGISTKDMYNSLYQFYRKSKSVKEGDLIQWFNLYYRTIDSWAIGITIVDLIRKMSLWTSFSDILQKHKSKLFPLLRKMCAVSPLERIDCVQALYYLDPNHFIIRKYAKQWLSIVGDFSHPFSSVSSINDCTPYPHCRLNSR